MILQTATPSTLPAFPTTFELRGGRYAYDGDRWYDPRSFQTPPRAVLQHLERLLRSQPWYEEHRTRRAADRRAVLMREHGLEPAATFRPSPTSIVRRTHYFRCKDDLNSLVDLQCATCGWIVCECGACGCIYGRDQPGRSPLAGELR